MTKAKRLQCKLCLKVVHSQLRSLKAVTSHCKQPDPDDKQAVPCLPCKLSSSDNPPPNPPHTQACYANTLKHMRAATANHSEVYAWCRPYNRSVIEFLLLQRNQKKEKNQHQQTRSQRSLRRWWPRRRCQRSAAGARGSRYANVSRHVCSQGLCASWKKTVSQFCSIPEPRWGRWWKRGGRFTGPYMAPDFSMSASDSQRKKSC